MIRRKDGFALVELIITMAVFVVVMTMASQMFRGLLNQFKQQSKISETNIEGLIGLQMLRSDLEQAGYGRPYEIPGVSYLEADNSVATATAHDRRPSLRRRHRPRRGPSRRGYGFTSSLPVQLFRTLAPELVGPLLARGR